MMPTLGTRRNSLWVFFDLIFLTQAKILFTWQEVVNQVAVEVWRSLANCAGMH